MRLASRKEGAMTGPNRSESRPNPPTTEPVTLPAAIRATDWAFFIHVWSLQSLDTVANFCRSFKLEFLGCIPHALLELIDKLLALLRRHFFRGIFRLYRHSDIIAL